MPITSTDQNNSPAIRNAAPTNGRIRGDAAIAIAALQLADVWRQGTIVNLPGSTVRIDCQGLTNDGTANLQIQINGQRGSSTVACVLVASTLTANNHTVHQQNIATAAIRTALTNSLAWQLVIALTGAP